MSLIITYSFFFLPANTSKFCFFATLDWKSRIRKWTFCKYKKVFFSLILLYSWCPFSENYSFEPVCYFSISFFAVLFWAENNIRVTWKLDKHAKIAREISKLNKTREWVTMTMYWYNGLKRRFFFFNFTLKQ